MKSHLKVKDKLRGAIKFTGRCMVVLVILLLPALGYSQPSSPPGNGGSPDTPLSVPFDSKLNLLLLLAGVVFATIIIVKMQKNKAVVKID